MKKRFTVGEAAREARLTAETLRHYDRIGLVKPSCRDPQTGYRCYTEPDIVRLNTVHALKQMDLPLQRIGEVLSYDSLEKIVAALADAERQADAKMEELRRCQDKIRLARQDYERKLRARDSAQTAAVRRFPARVILLADTVQEPALDNLWNYLSPFYARIPQAQRDQFAFADQAGVYTEGGRSRLFALCTRHAPMEGLQTLPAGRYLCLDCPREARASCAAELTARARRDFQADPAFVVGQIVVSGILQWTYQLQVYLGV